MIKMQIVGSLGKDAEVKTLDSGRSVINFSVAHTERYKNAAGELKETTTWVNCAYWVKTTGIAPYLKKGTKVYVEGNPAARAFNKSDGTAAASLEMTVQKVELLGQPAGNRTDNQAEPSTASEAESWGGGSDDLPF